MEHTVEKNYVRPVARAGPVLRAVTGAALVLLGCAVLPGCNKGTDPKPMPKYLLYAAMVHPPDQATGFIAVIDCETDSVIDSVKNLSGNPGVVASPDGKYFAALASGSPARIFDAVSRTQIKPLGAPGLLPLFLPDAGIVVYPNLDSTCVYSVPEFAVKEVWSRPRSVIERRPGMNHLAAVERLGSGPLENRSRIVIFDYLTGRAIDSVVISPDAQGVGFQVINFAFSPDGDRLYATGGQNGFGAGVVGYDLKSRRTLFRQWLHAGWGYCRVTPDGREVWVTDPGSLNEDSPTPQIITILDAVSGIVLDTISIRGISPSSAEPLQAWDIRFVPDGLKAYVNCGSFFKGRQPILVINTRTRHIDRLIFGDFRDQAMMIDIAARP